MVGLPGIGIVFHGLGVELVLFLGRQIVAPGGFHVQAQGVHVIVQILPGLAFPRRGRADAFHVGAAVEHVPAHRGQDIEAVDPAVTVAAAVTVLRPGFQLEGRIHG